PDDLVLRAVDRHRAADRELLGARVADVDEHFVRRALREPPPLRHLGGGDEADIRARGGDARRGVRRVGDVGRRRVHDLCDRLQRNGELGLELLEPLRQAVFEGGIAAAEDEAATPTAAATGSAATTGAATTGGITTPAANGDALR